MLKIDPSPISTAGGSSSANGSGSSASQSKQSKSTGSTSTSPSAVASTLRWILLEFPFWIVVTVWAATWFSHALYVGPLQTLIESFRRSPNSVDAFGYYTDFIPDMTYYGRQCDGRDITTSNSNDLIVPDARLDGSTSTSTSTTSTTTPEQQAREIMMTHGAVLIRNLLSNETAYQLREYLETRHAIKDKLPWHEKFWGDIGRLSLGLGVDDHPTIIARALQEVGTHEVLRTTLEGIVGPDPAIVEISTLTTLHGAQMQGIHTDSDYFASSLLYSRTFLHSYTLFMALQDTTSKMGATTVCPGTQWCANEDLSDICLPVSTTTATTTEDEQPFHQAFEVSSNGQTGRDVGLLYQGDGMMFNQNIWHRGPRNIDKDRIMNRVMFIVTFVSRQEHDNNANNYLKKKKNNNGDVRQQGLGTYYYQRWNMWGHTYEDLKHAATRMTQPIAALRALGIWKLPHTKWGIPWLEHFARQLANDEDFFSHYELRDFLKFLDESLHVPRWLQGRRRSIPKDLLLLANAENDNKEPNNNNLQKKHRELMKLEQLAQEEEDEELEWESFLIQFATNIKDLADQIHWIALAWYVIIHTTIIAVTQRGAGYFVKQVLVRYLVTAMFWLGLWHYVTQVSYLGRRIHMRDTWRQPFPEPPTPTGGAATTATRTTFPTRQDVLVGSRFDAPYLASFNHVLDYHPGNLEFQKALQAFGGGGPSSTPSTSTLLIQAYMNQPVQGVTPRFLQQDWQTGYWSLMTKEEATEFVARQVHAKKKKNTKNNNSKHGGLSLTGHLDEHLKIVLADARFGRQRETIMARKFTSQIVLDWQSVLYRKHVHTKNDQGVEENATTATVTTKPSTTNKSRMMTASLYSVLSEKNVLPTTLASSSPVSTKTPSLLIFCNAKGSTLRVVRKGDRVMAPYFESGEYWEATVGIAINDDLVSVDYAMEGGMGATHVVPKDSLRPFYSLVQGDLAQVENVDTADDEDAEWLTVQILSVHPLGDVTVRYIDYDDDDDIPDEILSSELIRLPSYVVDPAAGAAAAVAATPPLVVDSPSYPLAKGDRVLAQYDGEGQWFPARIHRIHTTTTTTTSSSSTTKKKKNAEKTTTTTTYSLKFAGGDFEDNVPLARIKPLSIRGKKPKGKARTTSIKMSNFMMKSSSSSSSFTTRTTPSASSSQNDASSSSSSTLASPSLGEDEEEEVSSYYMHGQQVLAFFNDDDQEDDEEESSSAAGWFPATIVHVHENGGGYDVDFADGDSAVGVPVDQIRPLPPSME